RRTTDEEFGRLWSLVRVRADRTGGKVALVLLPDGWCEVRRPAGFACLWSFVPSAARNSSGHAFAETFPHQQNLRWHEERLLDLRASAIRPTHSRRADGVSRW